MWRDRVNEIRKEKGISIKMLSEKSGITEETLTRILSVKHVKTDSPRISTISDVCRAIEVEVWEIFYTGEKSLVNLQAEIAVLRSERDALISENGTLKDKVESLRDKVDVLKDEIINTHNHYIKIQNKNQ